LPACIGFPDNAMYVCVCNAITDREIRCAAELGARSLSDLSATLGVATCCRRCADCAVRVLHEALADNASCAVGDD
jgi:bacterioferritin-associated ferredoxin